MFEVTEIKQVRKRKKGEEEYTYQIKAEEDEGNGKRKLTIKQDFEPVEEVGDSFQWDVHGKQQKLSLEEKAEVVERAGAALRALAKVKKSKKVPAVKEAV